MPDLCPYCGSNEILNDYFDDDWFFWCGRCFREIQADCEDEWEGDIKYEDLQKSADESPMPSDKR